MQESTNQNNPNPSFAAPAVPQEPSDFRDQLVGEGRKYATEADALKGLFHANQHIQTIEQENQQLKNDLAVRAGVEEILKSNVDDKRLLQTPQTLQQLEPQNPQVATPAQGEVQSAEDISELVRQAMLQQQEQSQKSKNHEEATRTLDKIFGSREATNAAVEKRAKELGIGVGLLKETSERSPAAFYLMMNVTPTSDGSPKSVAPLKGGISTEALRVQTPANQIPEGTYRWYESLRKSDPASYHSSRVQKELFEAAKENPDKFYER